MTSHLGIGTNGWSRQGDMPLLKQESKMAAGPTDAFAELEALRSAKEREVHAAGAAQPIVPAVALQQFLVLLQAKKFEKAKALAFRRACSPLASPPMAPIPPLC